MKTPESEGKESLAGDKEIEADGEGSLWGLWGVRKVEQGLQDQLPARASLFSETGMASLQLPQLLHTRLSFSL